MAITNKELADLLGTVTVGADHTETLNAAYQKAFGRDADAEGLAYWSDRLDNGLAATDLLEALLDGADAYVENAEYPENVAVNATDKTTIVNKLEVAEAIQANTAVTAEQAATILATVTTDASKTTALDDVAAIVSGETFVLTTGEDTVVGTANNDLITGTTAELGADDRIMDTSTTDNDVFNLTATADPVAMDVTNIESINIDWDAFGTPDIDLTNVIGATVTLSSDKAGYLGNANFDNVDRNNIVVGDGITGDVTVDTTVDSTIDAGNAETLTVTAADRDLTITANNSGTVSVAVANDVDNLTMSATSATTVVADANREASLTLGADADLTITGTAEYTLSSDADIQLDVAAGAAFENITLAGTGAITLSFANAADVAGQEIINGGAIILEDEIAATNDFTKVSHSTITLEDDLEDTTSASAAMTLASGAHVVLEVDMSDTSGYTTTFETAAADDATTGDELTLTVQSDQTEALITQGGAGDFELVNVIVDATAVDNAADVTLADIQAGTDKVVFGATTNDFVVSDIDASEVDATAVSGDFEITSSGDADMVVAGGSADNDVTFTGVDKEQSFVGQAGDDSVTFATTTGDAAAIVNDGDNTVTATGVIAGTGQLTVVAGEGDDEVIANAATTGTIAVILGNGANSLSATSLTSGEIEYTGGNGVDTLTADALDGGTVTADLGDGDNVATIDVSAAGTSTVTLTAGTGDDTFNLTSANAEDDKVTITAGTGTDTLVIATDIADLDLTLNSVEVIDINDATAAANVNAALLNGASYTIKGDGTAADTLAVEMFTTLDDVDFSNITIDNTLSNGLAGLDVTATADDNTIVLTAGNDTIDLVDGENTLTAGKGKDTITAGDGADTFVIAGADTGSTIATADTIAEFTTGTDKLSLGTTGSATNFATATGAADEAAALTAANTAFDGTVQYYFAAAIVADVLGSGASSDSLLFVDSDLDGTADDVIGLIGLTAGDLVATDIIA